MSDLYKSGISIEKFAAYLDGNLSSDEMLKMNSVVSENRDLQTLIDKNSVLNELLLGNDSEYSELPNELQSSDFELPNLENISIEGDIFSDDSSLYSKEQINIDSMKNDYDDLSDHSIFGESGTNDGTEYNPFIQQSYDNTCAIRSQQIVLRDYGVDISEGDLREIALQNGWYSADDGTPMGDVGNILEMAGIECHQSENNTVYDLVGELSQGHRVIVGVDSGELWAETFADKAIEKVEDFVGLSGPDHALIVAGIDVNPNNPNDIKVVLTDPGSGDLRKEYDIKQFLDAWKDGNCFMVSTDEPAPYQFDPSTGREIPSGFLSDYSPNAFVCDHGYQLSLDDLTIPDDYVATYSEENGIDLSPFEVFNDNEDSNAIGIIADDGNEINDIDMLDDII